MFIRWVKRKYWFFLCVSQKTLLKFVEVLQKRKRKREWFAVWQHFERERERNRECVWYLVFLFDLDKGYLTFVDCLNEWQTKCDWLRGAWALAVFLLWQSLQKSVEFAVMWNWASVQVKFRVYMSRLTKDQATWLVESTSFKSIDCVCIV